MQFQPGFNKEPVVPVRGMEKECVTGWEAIAARWKDALNEKQGESRILVVETYQGVYLEILKCQLERLLEPGLLIDTAGLLKEEGAIREMTHPDVTDDRVFGYLTRLTMHEFMDRNKVEKAREKVLRGGDPLTVIMGYGASLVVPDPDLLIYADMARWEIQRRMRLNEVDNLGISNRGEHPELKYKRGFFVDWRVCDRLKKETYPRWDFVLDTNDQHTPKLATAAAVKEGLRQATTRPFSVVPFFDPGPWGGQWMKQRFGLSTEVDNFAWCFNCVPEENSLLLGFGETHFEVPSINLVFFQTLELLGEEVHARFGAEFPIRFDFLDTMEGGNLSLQVHPLTEYIQEKFGMHYTQDESYYMMEAAGDGSVYLGLREEVDRKEMTAALRESERQGTPFPVDRYVENWPAKKHDHFLIPAGTIHCSGRNGMVLEISATPYIFTFKLYDWGRKNLDGKPRPINVAHGLGNIQWNRTTSWVKKNLVNRVEQVGRGEGWTEERTGLHEAEFIETRRHWFTSVVPHHTENRVHVLNLVEGEEVVVESPEGTFDPFVVHYAETFIIPAAVGPYTIRPHGPSVGKKCATIKAFVRTRT
jgi:mannose-6-phosphate isomerase class I